MSEAIRAKAKKYVKELATIECVHYHQGQFTTKQRYITPELERAYYNGYQDGYRERGEVISKARNEEKETK